MALALGTVALRNTPLMLSFLEAQPDRDEAIDLLAEGFDMLEEDSRRSDFSPRPARLTGRRREASRDARRLMQTLDRETGLLMDYSQSGVDIDAGNETVRRIKILARATFTPGVLSEIGSFGGLFQPRPRPVSRPGARCRAPTASAPS